MRRRAFVPLLALAMLLTSLVLSSCKPISAPLGSPQNPIKLYFVPSVEVSVIVESGEAIADFLKGQTGYEFEVRVPTTYAAVVEEMGAAEGDAMAFIPAMGYVLSHDRYGADVALSVVRYGWGFYWTEYLVQRDSDIQSLEDLNGKTWAYPSTTSTSGYLVPASFFKKHGIEPGLQLDAGGHPQAVAAVYEGQADFATVYFSAPGNDWEIGDPLEPGGEFTYEEVEGKIKVYQSGERIRDARTTMLSSYKDVVEKVRVLAISDPIPNDTVSFCRGFPETVRNNIVQGLIDYANTEEGLEVLANDEFYDITGFQPVSDAEFQPIRDMIEQMGLSEEDILH